MDLKFSPSIIILRQVKPCLVQTVKVRALWCSIRSILTETGKMFSEFVVLRKHENKDINVGLRFTKTKAWVG